MGANITIPLFRSNGKMIKLLSKAARLMPEKIKKETEFVEMIIGVNKENVEHVFTLINEDNVKKAGDIINFSVEIRPKEIETFLTLVSLISSKFGDDKLQDFSNYFLSILASQDVLPQENEEEDNEAYTEFATGSIEHAIREDNVGQFCELFYDKSFNDKIKFNIGSENTYVSYLQLIAYFGSIKCFKQAVMNDDIDLTDISKYAVAGGSNEIIRILEQKGVSFDNCFEIGVKYHRMNLCDWLLTRTKCESISLLSSLRYFNYPAFFFTMINEKRFNDALPAAAEQGSIDVVKYIVEQCQANVEDKDTKGLTPLHIAANEGHIEIVKYLFEKYPANVEQKDQEYGWTPLHNASGNGHIDVIKYLLENCHANIEAKSNDGMTPLHIASENGKIEVLEYFIKQFHANVEEKTNIGMTPLHIATNEGHIDIVKYLKEQCHANAEDKDNFGRTPLFYASKYGHIDIVKYLKEQCHANVEEKDNFGRTPLFYASQYGHIDVIRYLKEQCHAKFDEKDDSGRTPLYFATNEGHIKASRYLHEQSITRTYKL
jgi:ankyrin repeat protein